MTAQEFWDILHNMPEPQPVFWRLYYNAETGQPICYTMEDLPGNYIDVDADTFARSPMNVKVVNGKLVLLPPTVYVDKLCPASTGTLCHNQDVAVVVEKSGTYWKKKSYSKKL